MKWFAKLFQIITKLVKPLLEKKIEEKVEEYIEDLSRRSEPPKINPAHPDVPPADAVAPNNFGVFPRVPNPWDAPVNIKITSVTQHELRWEGHRAEYIIATSNGDGTAHSDKAASHPRSTGYNKHLGFPVYVCIFHVEDGRSRTVGRSPIFRVE